MQSITLTGPSREDFLYLPSSVQVLKVDWMDFIIDDIPPLPNLQKFILRYSLQQKGVLQLFSFLSQLPHLSELEIIEVYDTFTNENLKHFSLLHHLESLTLDGCWSDKERFIPDERRFISDEDEFAFDEDWVGSTDEVLNEDVLSHIQHMTKLKKIKVDFSFTLTDLTLEHLSECKTLEEVNLGRGEFGDEGLNALSQLKNLKKVCLSECSQATDSGFTSLLLMPSLEEIKLKGCNTLTLGALSKPSYATNLVHLELQGARFLCKGNWEFPMLKSLFLECRDLELCAFTFPPSLEHLKIKSVLAKEHLSSLRPLVHLQALSIQMAILDQGGAVDLQIFKNLKKLHVLQLSGSQFASSHDVSILKELPQLESLDLENVSGLDDKTLIILSNLENLNYLSLRECQGFTSEGLKQLSRLKNLRELNLNWCSGISEEIFKELSKLEKLEELHLRSDQGSESVLRAVTQIPHLKILHIVKNRIDNDKLQEIIDLHPTLQRIEIERFPTILKRAAK